MIRVPLNYGRTNCGQGVVSGLVSGVWPGAVLDLCEKGPMKG